MSVTLSVQRVVFYRADLMNVLLPEVWMFVVGSAELAVVMHSAFLITFKCNG